MTSGDLPSAAGSATTYQTTAAASSAGAIGMMMHNGTAQNVLTTIARLQADLPNDLQQLKDLTTEMILSHMVHQEKCREWMYQLIDDKHVAQHRSNMLEVQLVYIDQVHLELRPITIASCGGRHSWRLYQPARVLNDRE